MAFIDAHRGRFGVEPICAVLTEHGVGIAPSAYYAAKTRPPSARALRDGWLREEIARVHQENYDEECHFLCVRGWSESVVSVMDPGATERAVMTENHRERVSAGPAADMTPPRQAARRPARDNRTVQAPRAAAGFPAVHAELWASGTVAS
ncbi:hypothetical protein [Candidatus Poriferisodalis sp.]|uniref:hypothetical protein n=1 Tax=Candidatus Poriferisodalis sp. TaxID=3101277 RepID=UPI003B015F64